MDVLILEVGGHRGQSRHTLHLRDKPPRPVSVDRRQTNEEERERARRMGKRNRFTRAGDRERHKEQGECFHLKGTGKRHESEICLS